MSSKNKDDKFSFNLMSKSGKFSINFADMMYSEKDIDSLGKKLEKAYTEVKKIEAGEIKNLDENRQVTHFTDRAEYQQEDLFTDVHNFAEEIRNGSIKSSSNEKFEYVVINGIGGSALGPQFMQFAINGPYWNELSEDKRKSYPKIYFLDNTDTSGVHDVLQVVDLTKTLVVSISKSGGTQETKNNIIAMEQVFAKANIDIAKHSCAITMVDSQLDKKAKSENWLKVFPMAESIGGRTSETSIVGQLPAVLTGIDFSEFIDGAKDMDTWTREENYKKNPAYMLAAMWYLSGNGKGDKNMVIVPYSDRLVLLSKYLQQLVMESIGKQKDRDGNIVHQGLTVFGNKGGTDAHAYIQQLNDGRNDFFITFIEVLQDAMCVPVDENITMGDYLHGFQVGLSNALKSRDRGIISVKIEAVTPYNLGMLIALYERAVAVYAELININAFHQPGVQAYKLASKSVIQSMNDVDEALSKLDSEWNGDIDEFCAKFDFASDKEVVEGILNKISENEESRTFLKYSIKKVFRKSKWNYTIINK